MKLTLLNFSFSITEGIKNRETKGVAVKIERIKTEMKRRQNCVPYSLNLHPILTSPLFLNDI